MLAYPLALAYFFEWLGFSEVTFPIKRESTVWYMQFQDYRPYLAMALGLLAISLVVSLWIERSRFGMSLLAIKQNELAAEAAGIDTFAWKMRPENPNPTRPTRIGFMNAAGSYDSLYATPSRVRREVGPPAALRVPHPFA